MSLIPTISGLRAKAYNYLFPERSERSERSDDTDLLDSFQSAESHLGEVAAPIIQNQTQSRVLSGQYHYEENLIVLKVEEQKMGADGRYEAPTTKEVSYEVVSLNVKEKGSDNSVEVLGARTEEALKPIMEQFIKSFTEVKNAHSLLESETKKDLHTLDEYKSSKSQLKTITYSLDAQKQDPMLNVQNTYISKAIEELPVREQDKTEFSKDQIQNPDVLRQLLVASYWKSMIKTAKTTSGKPHEYVCKHPKMKGNEELLGEMTSFLFKKEIDASGLEKDSLFDSFQRDLSDNHIHQRNQLLDVLPKYELLGPQLKEKIKSTEAQLKEYPLNSTLLLRLEGQKSCASEIEKKVKEIESQIKHIQNSLNLSQFIKEKKVIEQRSSFGSVPFTELHTQDWYEKLDALGLFDKSHWEIRTTPKGKELYVIKSSDQEFLEKSNKQEQAERILKSNLSQRKKVEFSTFFSALKACEDGVNIEFLLDDVVAPKPVFGPPSHGVDAIPEVVQTVPNAAVPVDWSSVLPNRFNATSLHAKAGSEFSDVSLGTFNTVKLGGTESTASSASLEERAKPIKRFSNAFLSPEFLKGLNLPSNTQAQIRKLAAALS